MAPRVTLTSTKPWRKTSLVLASNPLHGAKTVAALISGTLPRLSLPVRPFLEPRVNSDLFFDVDPGESSLRIGAGHLDVDY